MGTESTATKLIGLKPSSLMKKTVQENAHLGRKLVRRGLLVLLLSVEAWGLSLAALGLSFQARLVRLQQMVADPVHLNLAAVAPDVNGAREELVLLRNELAPLLWIGARIGGDWGVAEPMMNVAVEATTAADESVGALTPSVGDLTPASFSMSLLPGVLDSLATARPALKRAERRLDSAVADLARVNGPLSPRVEHWVVQANTLVDLGRQAIGAALIVPELLGQEGPRTYLVLVQNSDELRPTGGFISDVGVVVINHGAIISQTFQDSYAVDDFSQYYPDPPKPLRDYMSSEQWVVRDANWSPDFPTTARAAVRLFQISRQEHIDGVIGINQKAVQILIAAVEPLTVEGMSEPVTAANLELMAQIAWNPIQDETGQVVDTNAWLLKRKQFIDATARAATDKFLFGQVNWIRLAQGTLAALRERSMMIYTARTNADQLRRLNWDGALRPDPGDYLMVVDSNVGFAKANPLVDESILYAVALQPDGTGRASLRLSYTHRGTHAGIVCTPIVHYNQELTYEQMKHRCYFDYLRLVVPPGSRLLGATAHPVPGTYLLSGKEADGTAEVWPDEVGRTVFGQFFVVEYGQFLQTSFDYALPVIVSDANGLKRYTLVLQKQSGTGPWPVTVTLTLPPKSRLVSANPSPVSQSGDSLEFSLTLDADKQVEIVYVSAR